MQKRSRLTVVTAFVLAALAALAGSCASEKAQSAPAGSTSDVVPYSGPAPEAEPSDAPPPPTTKAPTAPTTTAPTTATTTPMPVRPEQKPAEPPKPMLAVKDEAKRRVLEEAREKSKTDAVAGKKADPKKAFAGDTDDEVPVVDVVDGADKGGTFVHAGTNPFVDTAKDPLSTFAIDVDTGSFSFARRFLKQGNLPPEAAVRVEEWVNAMHYGYAPPAKSAAVPFAVHVAGAPSPIAKGKTLVRVALQGKEVSRAERQATSLVFLVDVSGSMSDADKLPLAKDAMRMLVNQLREDDQVSIVTYAGSTQVILPLTSAANKAKIFAGIDALNSGGGTNMGSGLELAYREATKGLGGGKSARVMVLSDGDANIGRTSHEEILKSIKGYVSEGVMMSTVGMGTGNYNDHLMEQLADAGNGNYSYIDSMKTAEKVFVAGLNGTLEVIAQDVKIQVEWNNDKVVRYRLLGYENRDVADADFRNDKKDAGEIGAGHSVTALYEVEVRDGVDGDLGTVRVRAKKPRGTKAEELAVAITPSMLQGSAMKLDDDAIAASAVALAAEILRGSPYAEGRTLSEAAELLMGAAVGKHADERKELAKELLLVEPRLARR
jgi:Ca-activated chloride channel family protein